uniref:TIR domain-containing protein n=1 Tax=Megaselia scalaris TaxID=36166 RepID=T1GFU3_MEGSC
MMFNTSQPPASTRYLRIPLKHLTDKTRSVLSVSLNNKKHIRAENGFCRDWRGIIELCGLRKGYYDIVDNSSDHMEKLLELWCLKEGDLCPKANKPITSPLPVERNEVLTLQDLKRIEEGKPLRNYDAFLLFEDEDAEFVQTLLAKLSNYHICMKSDLVRQTFEHTAVVELIEKRCRRVIAVISEHFLYSPSNANRFLVDFAQASQVESGDLRIIPVVTEREVEKYIPSNLKYLHKVQYYKNSPLYDFWRILESTLMDKSALYNKMQQITMAESVRKNT